LRFNNYNDLLNSIYLYGKENKIYKEICIVKKIYRVKH
jgi:hypothetical protein